MRVRTDPRMTFSSICRYLAASTPTAQLSEARSQKYPSEGPTKSYIKASHYVCRRLVDGRSLLPADSLRPHEREAVEELATSWTRPDELVFVRPDPKQPKMHFHDVEISCYPTALVRHPTTGESGAIKIFFNKKPRLKKELGRTMATLLHRYLVEVHGQDASPGLTWVVDARTGEVHEASPRHKQLMRRIEDACLMVGSVWPRL